MSNKKSYGKIIWVNHYTEPPESAEFILRFTDSLEWRFEKYKGYESSVTLKNFPCDAMDEEHRLSTLMECRKLAHSRKVIYVERF